MTMKRKTIWVISPFSNPFLDIESDRYKYICSVIHENNFKVINFVSSFDHHKKKQKSYNGKCKWIIVNVYEPGYIKNVSISRIISHFIFNLSLPICFFYAILKYGLPKSIFCAIPHNGSAIISYFFGKIVNATVVVDIHDTWPESVLSIHNLNYITKIIYSVLFKIESLAIYLPDYVFAESQKYADRANSIRVGSSKSSAQPILLGGNINYYNLKDNAERIEIPFNLDRFIIAYSGNLGINNDLDCIIKAFNRFNNEYKDSLLLFIGAGEREEEIKQIIQENNLDAFVTGRVSYSLLVDLLKISNVGLNSFKVGGNVAYSYKINDYFLCGLPVINSLHGEVAQYINQFKLGWNYLAGDVDSLYDAMVCSYINFNSNEKNTTQLNQFVSTKLNRDVTYRPILKALT